MYCLIYFFKISFACIFIINRKIESFPGCILSRAHDSFQFLPIIPPASWRVYSTWALWLQSSRVETWPHQWPRMITWPWRPLQGSSLTTRTYTFTPSSSSSSSASCVCCSWWRSSTPSASTAHFNNLLKTADKTQASAWTERTPPSDAVPPVTRQGISSEDRWRQTPAKHHVSNISVFSSDLYGWWNKKMKNRWYHWKSPPRPREEIMFFLDYDLRMSFIINITIFHKKTKTVCLFFCVQ